MCSTCSGGIAAWVPTARASYIATPANSRPVSWPRRWHDDASLLRGIGWLCPQAAAKTIGARTPMSVVQPAVRVINPSTSGSQHRGAR